MLQSQISSHFRTQAERLIAGDLAGIAVQCSFPLPIHFPNTLTVAFTPAQRGAMLEKRRLDLVARGVVALHPDITAIDLPREGRFRVWVDWKEQTASGSEMRGSSVIYYCRAGTFGLQTEMIQYTHVSEPGQPVMPQDLALSA